jgi:hypothetical protein
MTSHTAIFLVQAAAFPVGLIAGAAHDNGSDATTNFSENLWNI